MSLVQTSKNGFLTSNQCRGAPRQRVSLYQIREIRAISKTPGMHGLRREPKSCAIRPPKIAQYPTV
jgi:hypothetical protein